MFVLFLASQDADDDEDDENDEDDEDDEDDVDDEDDEEHLTDVALVSDDTFVVRGSPMII